MRLPVESGPRGMPELEINPVARPATTSLGNVAERFIAPDFKSGDLDRSVGSNPTVSVLISSGYGGSGRHAGFGYRWGLILSRGDPVSVRIRLSAPLFEPNAHCIISEKCLAWNKSHCN